jgi:hypothetical protein
MNNMYCEFEVVRLRSGRDERTMEVTSMHDATASAKWSMPSMLSVCRRVLVLCFTSNVSSTCM